MNGVLPLLASLWIAEVPPAPAPPAKKALFALVIGVNRGADEDLEPLRYADDDGAQYFNLFRMLGARTYLLSRFDENTRRLQPQAAAEALEPVAKQFEQAVAQVAEDVRKAKLQGIETVFYFVFAGHGNVRDGAGYISLEDARLTGKDLEASVVAKVPADAIHIIVDACYSSFLVYDRGAGGERRPIAGFAETSELLKDQRVGLLLSTSSARESHEWEGFQAGVFSHEVRSGLMGAADLNGDGVVDYREIAAFVERANAAIPNERFRPDVLAHPPEKHADLLDLRFGLQRRLEIDRSRGVHYSLEDAQGVRLADFHSPATQALHVLRPMGPLYLVDDENHEEFLIPAPPEVVMLSSLSPEPARTKARGADANAFALLFSLPFDRQAVEYYQLSPAPAVAAEAKGSSGRPWVAGGLLVLGGVLAGGGVWATLDGRSTANGINASTPEASARSANTRIQTDNLLEGVGYAVGGAALATALVLLVWPSHDGSAVAGTSVGSNGLLAVGHF